MKMIIKVALGFFGVAWLIDSEFFGGGELSSVASAVYASALLVCCFIDEVMKK